MPRPVIAPWILRLVLGTACVALLVGLYLAGAPALLPAWEAGATRPTAVAGWYQWPQWVSALLVAVTSGLVYAAATRLGASPFWAASSSLSCGFGWALWMIAAIPSAKSAAMLMTAAGVAATAWWAASPRLAWLIVGAACLVAGAWLQPLLPPGASVRMSATPAQIVRLVVGELRPLAFILALVGVAHLWSGARRATGTLGGVLAIYLLLPLVSGVSPEATLLPASLLLWMAVAFGLHWVARAGPPRPMWALACVLALLLPAERWLLTHTLMSRAATPFFPGSLAVSLASVTPGATVIVDSADTERRVARTAAVLPVGPFHVMLNDTRTQDDGSSDVFAFNLIRPEMEALGHELRTVSRRAPLSVFLRMLRPENIVAIALTPVAANVLSREGAAYFSGVGAPDTATAALASALIGRAHAASGALVQQDREVARVAVATGAPWGDPISPSPIAIEAVADRAAAAIAVEGREIVRVPHGGAVVVTSREGLLQAAYVITADQRLMMPMPADEWSIAQLVRQRAADAPLPDPFFAHPMDASALVRFDGRDQAYFKGGWHLPERSGAIDFIWTAEAQSHWAIPLVQPLELRVIVELSPAVADDRDPPLVGLHVNGVRFAQHPAPPGRRVYAWRVPEATWRAGANDVAIELTKTMRPLGSLDQRLLGAAVSLFRLERVGR